MWRRDTKTVRIEAWRRCGRSAAAFAASAALHGTLLATVGGVALGGLGFPSVIPVSLRGAPGIGPAAPGPQAEGSAPSVEGAMPAAAPVPVVPRAKAARRVAAAKPRRAAESRVETSSPGAGTSGAALPATTGGDGPPSGAGADGSGGASGAGRGSGGAQDRRPSCQYCPPPSYPWIARARGWQGTADVGLRLGGDGSVRETILRRSSGYDVLDAAAIDAARRSRFQAPESDPPGDDAGGFIQYRFELSARKGGE